MEENRERRRSAHRPFSILLFVCRYLTPRFFSFFPHGIIQWHRRKQHVANPTLLGSASSKNGFSILFEFPRLFVGKNAILAHAVCISLSSSLSVCDWSCERTNSISKQLLLRVLFVFAFLQCDFDTANAYSKSLPWSLRCTKHCEMNNAPSLLIIDVSVATLRNNTLSLFSSFCESFYLNVLWQSVVPSSRLVPHSRCRLRAKFCATYRAVSRRLETKWKRKFLKWVGDEFRAKVSSLDRQRKWWWRWNGKDNVIH